jgi:hypothetical protein
VLQNVGITVSAVSISEFLFSRGWQVCGTPTVVWVAGEQQEGWSGRPALGRGQLSKRCSCQHVTMGAVSSFGLLSNRGWQVYGVRPSGG